MELVKRQIHMNRWKGNVATQLTLDDDFIVPDTLDDMEQIMLDTGEIQIEAVKNQGSQVAVKGRLEFQVLYLRENGGLQTLGGTIPFEETVNVAELEEKDYIGLNWMLEDLSVEMIHSRKLGVKAIVTLQVRVETLRDVEAAVDLALPESGEPFEVEVKKRRVNAAAMAVRRKDTFRIREEAGLTGGKPNIGQLLWREMKLRDVDVKPLDGKLELKGELAVFLIYSPEDDTMPVQWMEEVIPFSGLMEMSDVREEQIPMITVRLSHREFEAKPDDDGELRNIELDAVLELDVKLYEEQETELLSDLYSNSCQLETERREAAFDQILARNVCRPKITEKIKIPEDGRILQLCHNEGSIKLDEVEIGENSLQIDGILEVVILYLTNDDASPIRSFTKQLPFHCEAEAIGIRQDSVYQLDAGLEQLSAVMTGGDMVEVKAAITLDFLVLQPVQEQVITGITVKPLDLKLLQEFPGIVGYIVQQGDSLWEIAKRFHTTMGTIISSNELADSQVKPGQRLLLVKELGGTFMT